MRLEWRLLGSLCLACGATPTGDGASDDGGTGTGESGAETTTSAGTTSESSTGGTDEGAADSSATSDSSDETAGTECEYGELLVLDGEDRIIETELELDALTGIACVEGGVQVVLDDISDLAPMADLRSVSEFLSFLCVEPPCTANFEILEVREVGSILDLEGIDLPDASAFDTLVELGGLVVLRSELESLIGLEGVTTLGSVRLYGNAKLASLEGLHNVTMVSNSIELGNCDGETWPFAGPLQDLDGLLSLQSVGQSLKICDAPGLTSLAGLDSLETVDHTLQIAKNENLTSLDGAPNLTTTGYATVWANPQLPTCLAEAFVNALEWEDAPDVFENLPDACGG